MFNYFYMVLSCRNKLGDNMTTYTITESQFNSTNSDMPDMGLIIEALKDVENEISPETVWAYKGNYKLSFWKDNEHPQTIFCNVFVLANPDNPNDSSTLNYLYYFEIKAIH
jgi:hypothetical protein